MQWPQIQVPFLPLSDLIFITLHQNLVYLLWEKIIQGSKNLRWDARRIMNGYLIDVNSSATQNPCKK